MANEYRIDQLRKVAKSKMDDVLSENTDNIKLKVYHQSVETKWLDISLEELSALMREVRKKNEH